MEDITLHDALKSSYGDKKARQKLANAGYQYDSMLSNHNQQVYYHPKENKLLYNVAGTHNFGDVGTDVYLAMGKLKDTQRYKEASNKLEEAKRKYNINSATVTGHSLGGSIGQRIASKDDKFYGLDSGYTLGQKTRDRDGNHHHYRSEGDLVSALGANAKHMETVSQNRFGILNYINPFGSHNVDNIKNNKIRI